LASTTTTTLVPPQPPQQDAELTAMKKKYEELSLVASQNSTTIDTLLKALDMSKKTNDTLLQDNKSWQTNHEVLLHINRQLNKQLADDYTIKQNDDAKVKAQTDVLVQQLTRARSTKQKDDEVIASLQQQQYQQQQHRLYQQQQYHQQRQHPYQNDVNSGLMLLAGVSTSTCLDAALARRQQQQHR